MKGLLLRADDLGYSEGVNYGILRTIQSGVIRTVGLMVNMSASQHGIDLIKDYDLCLGLHTNICVGKPLTPQEKIPSLCQENGEFKSSAVYRDVFSQGEDFVVFEEVVQEIEAQYHRFVSLTNRQPDYFEGHAVASPTFFRGLEYVAQKYDLPYFAMSLDGKPVEFKGTKIYSYLPKNLKTYEQNPLKAIFDCARNLHQDGVDLMVFHPGYIDQYLLNHSSLINLRAKEAEILSDRNLKNEIENLGVSLVTYKDLN